VGRAACRTWCLTLAFACGDPTPDPTPSPRASSLELVIESQLGVRVGQVVRVWCGALPPGCTATLPDATRLQIRLAKSPDGWTWSVDGLVVSADPIEAYLRETLSDLGAVQAVRCAPRIRRLDPGGRIECSLERGGKAFATVRADGSFEVEIELDPHAGAARAEPATESELVNKSRAVEPDQDDDDGE